MPVDYLGTGLIYENPKPQVRSRHGYFPGLALLPSGELIALFVIAEAFEAADATTWVARSRDLGKTWELEGPLVASPDPLEMPASDYLKPTALANGTVAALGYRFHRRDPDQGISIEETCGILPGDDIIGFSRDGGRSWTRPRVIPRSRPELLEISGPCLELRSGGLIATAAPFRMPDGSQPSGQLGILLRSEDKGETWSDDTIFFRSSGGDLTPFESRVCEMQDGRLVALAWAYDTHSGRSYPNHIAVSHDNGRSWSEPTDTGCPAESSSLLWLGGDRLATIHAHRGAHSHISVKVVDFRRDRWNLVEQMSIYGAGSPQNRARGRTMTEMFASLRFGQPSLVRLPDDEFLAVHWAIEDGKGIIRTHRLRVRP